MGLTSDLISQFVKATNDKSESKKESTVYGTAVKYGETMYVKLDGSDLLTPMSTTVNAVDGERVMVSIKNHSATVIGNITSPAARNKDVTGAVELISEFNTVLAQKVDTETLDAEIARIDTLQADNVTIKNSLAASEAEIDTIKANNVEIEERLTASEADITKLKTDKLDASVAAITYATISDLEATNADIYNLSSTYAEFVKTTTDRLTANEASIESLQANKLDADTASITYATIASLNAIDADVTNLEGTFSDFKVSVTDKLAANDATIEDLKTNKLSASDIEGKYANIDFSNIGKAAMEYLYSNSGLIENVVIGDGVITGQLAGVTISGDLIEANTVKAEKLVIKGSDGLYYKLNTDGVTVESEQTNQNSLNGSVILAQSITASKINVDDLVAFNATIGGFVITEDSIYSGVKSSATNTTRGVYLDNDGQASFGDATNYLKYYKDSDNAYKLDISASSITLSTSNQNLETVLNENATAISNAQSTADSAVTDISALTTRISTAETNIDQNAEDILLRATKTEVSTAKSEAISTAASDATTKANNALTSAKSYADAQIQISADSINSTVSSVKAIAESAQADIDALEIGGRNLALKTNNGKTGWAWNTQTGGKIVESIETGGVQGVKFTRDDVESTGWSYIAFSYVALEKIEPDTEYTVSFDILVTETTTISFSIKKGDGLKPFTTNDVVAWTEEITPNEWTKITLTAKTRSELPEIDGQVIYFYFGNTSTGVSYSFRNLKLEKGNCATDWTPAPEDIDSDISALDTRITSAESSITQLSDRITTNVTETTNLGTRMTTVEQTATSLTTRITTAESDIVTAQSTADAAAKTATNFLSYDSINGLLVGNKTSGSWSGARAQITSDAFNVLDQNGVTLASYGTTTTIGKTSGNNVYIDSDSIDIRRNGSVVATFDQYGLKIANTNDSSGSLGSGTTKPALVIGTPTGYHIEMDNNEIMAKSNATTSSHLFLNMEGGNVSFNNNADRAMMFQEGALYAKNSSFNDGAYLGILDALNDAGNTTLGYGGYNNSIGSTNIYGNSISLVSNGNIDVEASWINCRSIAPNDHATYALGVYGEKGWSNIYLGKGDGKTNALHIINGSSTYLLCGVNSSGQYVFGNNAAIMYYQVKDVWTDNTGNAFKFTSGNNTASNNTTSVWLFGAADETSRYIGSYLAYSRTYSSAANMYVTANGVFGRSTSSSERYKNSIVDTDISELESLYDMPVKKFKYNDDYIAPDDELYDKYLYGFIVEDLEDILPCAVQHITDEDGNTLPEMWNSNIIVPALLKLIQDLNNRVKTLEGKG